MASNTKFDFVEEYLILIASTKESIILQYVNVKEFHNFMQVSKRIHAVHYDPIRKIARCPHIKFPRLFKNEAVGTEMEYIQKVCEEDSFVETVTLYNGFLWKVPAEKVTKMMSRNLKSKVTKCHLDQFVDQGGTAKHLSQFPNLKTYRGLAFPGLAGITSLESFENFGTDITPSLLVETAYTFLNPNLQEFKWAMHIAATHSFLLFMIAVLAGLDTQMLKKVVQKYDVTEDVLKDIDPEKLVYSGKSKNSLDLPNCTQSARWMLVPGMFSEIHTLQTQFLPEIEWVVKFFRTCGSKLKTVSFNMLGQTDEIFDVYHTELVRIYLHRRDVLKLPLTQCDFHSIGDGLSCEHLMKFVDSEMSCREYSVSAKFLAGGGECGRILDKVNKEENEVRFIGTVTLEDGPRYMEFSTRFCAFLRIRIRLIGIRGCYYWIKSFALDYDPKLEFVDLAAKKTGCTPLHSLCEKAIKSLGWRKSVKERAAFVEFFKRLLKLVFSVNPRSGEVTNNYPHSSFKNVMRHLDILKPTVGRFSVNDLID